MLKVYNPLVFLFFIFYFYLQLMRLFPYFNDNVFCGGVIAFKQ